MASERSSHEEEESSSASSAAASSKDTGSTMSAEFHHRRHHNHHYYGCHDHHHEGRCGHDDGRWGLGGGGCYHDVVLYSPLLDDEGGSGGEYSSSDEGGDGASRGRRRRRGSGLGRLAGNLRCSRHVAMLVFAAAVLVATLVLVPPALVSSGLFRGGRLDSIAPAGSGWDGGGGGGGIPVRTTPQWLVGERDEGEDEDKAWSSSSLTKLSHVGRAVLDELRHGTSTGIKGDLPNEGRGRTWGLDMNASMPTTTTAAASPSAGDPASGGKELAEAKADWLIYSPMNHLGERRPIAVPRSCHPGVDADYCHPDFFLPDCTDDESICDLPERLCHLDCPSWLRENRCTPEDGFGGVGSVLSSSQGFACHDECCPPSISANATTSTPQSSPTCRTVRSTITDPTSPSPPRRLCVGHSDAMYDTLYDLLTSAHSYVDVSSLDAPDGRFLASFRNALSFLHNSGRSVRVRYLVGVYGFKRGVDSILSSLTRDLPPNSTVAVSVGYWMDVHPKYDLSNIFRGRYLVNEGDGMSFNHAKIVAVDSSVVFTGGHNLRTGNFLTSSPIMDISVLVGGRGVTDSAHYYLNTQWDHVCRMVADGGSGEGGGGAGSWWWKRWWRRAGEAFGNEDVIRLAGVANFPPSDDGGVTAADRCPPPFVSVTPPLDARVTTVTAKRSPPGDDGAGDGGGGIPVFTVGRLGGLSAPPSPSDSSGPPSLNRDQTSDRAIIAMLRSAKSTIKLSQQDLGPPGGFDAKKHGTPIDEYWNLFGPHWTMIELCRALLRGVQVRVVLSSVSSPASSSSSGGGDGDGDADAEEVGMAPEENYANGWTTDDVVHMVRWYLRQGVEHGISPEASLPESSVRDVTCRNLTVTTVRYVPDGADGWSVGERCPRRFDFDGSFDPSAPTSTAAQRKKFADCDSMEARLFGLHTKLIVVDDVSFYVGSQNLYSTPLAEWGVVVDDALATRGVLTKFWDPLWEASSSSIAPLTTLRDDGRC